MSRVLVVWEDTYFEPLSEILQRAVRRLARGTDGSYPAVLHHTARSNTAFDRYVDTTWPNVSARGLPRDPGTIHHIICVVDGDKLSAVLGPAVPRPPNDAHHIADWHANAERAWQARLHRRAASAGPPADTIHGVVLRWSKESILLSGYDQPAFAEHLDCDVATPDVDRLLGTCQPPLNLVAPGQFSDSYRNPSQCLKALRTAARRTVLQKNAPQIDDALRKLARHSLATLCERAPDIDRIAAMIWKLHAAT